MKKIFLTASVVLTILFTVLFSVQSAFALAQPDDPCGVVTSQDGEQRFGQSVDSTECGSGGGGGSGGGASGQEVVPPPLSSAAKRYYSSQSGYSQWSLPTAGSRMAFPSVALPIIYPSINTIPNHTPQNIGQWNGGSTLSIQEAGEYNISYASTGALNVFDDHSTGFDVFVTFYININGVETVLPGSGGYASAGVLKTTDANDVKSTDYGVESGTYYLRECNDSSGYSFANNGCHGGWSWTATSDNPNTVIPYSVSYNNQLNLPAGSTIEIYARMQGSSQRVQMIGSPVATSVDFKISTGNTKLDVQKIEANQSPSVSLSARRMSVMSGETTTLDWTSTNASTCSAQGSWSGTKSTAGDESTGVLTTSKTYTIVCTGAGGSSSADVTVSVVAPPSTPTGFTAVPSNACGNNWLNLSWNAVSGATSYIVKEGSTTIYSGAGTSFSHTGLTPGSTHTYTVVASNASGTSATASASGTVVLDCTPTSPTVTLTASPTSVNYNSASTLSWSSTNSTSCTASGGWSGTKAISGSQSSGALTSDTLFTLTCTGPGGSAAASVAVTVGPQAPTGFTATASNACANNWLNLSWNAVSGATSYKVMEGAREVYNGSGTAVSDLGLVPGSTHTYTVVAMKGVSTSSATSATGTVGAACPLPPPAAPTGFTATASNACANNWLNLSWNAVSGATSYTVTEGVRIVYSGTSTAMSDTGLTPGSTHTYTLTASNSNGTSTAAYATGTVIAACAGGPAATLVSAQGNSVPYNSQFELWWTTANVTSCTANNVDVSWVGSKSIAGGGQAVIATATKTYTIDCTGPAGPASASVTVVVTGGPAPTVSLSANPTSVTEGSSASLSWSSTNTNVNGCTASNGWSGAKATSGSVLTGGLYSTTTYTLTCTGPGGSASSSATITVTAAPQPDVCDNIGGTQTSAPSGMHEGGDGNCYDDGDLCYNIAGAQYSVPADMTWDGVSTCTASSTTKKPWWREF